MPVIAKMGNKFDRVLAADGERFLVVVRLVGGTKVELSLAAVFSAPRGLAAEVMRGNLFEKCYVESGALAWPNGLELCADALLAEHATSSVRRGSAIRRRRRAP